MNPKLLLPGCFIRAIVTLSDTGSICGVGGEVGNVVEVVYMVINQESLEYGAGTRDGTITFKGPPLGTYSPKPQFLMIP